MYTWNVHMKCTPEIDMAWNTFLKWTWHEMYTWNLYDMKCTTATNMMKYTPEIDTPEMNMTWNVRLKLTWHDMTWYDIWIHSWYWHDMKCTTEINMTWIHSWNWHDMKYTAEIDITWNVDLKLTWHEMDTWNHVSFRQTNKRMYLYWTIWEATLHIIRINVECFIYAHHTRNVCD